MLAIAPEAQITQPSNNEHRVLALALLKDALDSLTSEVVAPDEEDTELRKVLRRQRRYLASADTCDRDAKECIAAAERDASKRQAAQKRLHAERRRVLERTFKGEIETLERHISARIARWQAASPTPSTQRRLTEAQDVGAAKRANLQQRHQARLDKFVAGCGKKSEGLAKEISTKRAAAEKRAGKLSQQAIKWRARLMSKEEFLEIEAAYDPKAFLLQPRHEQHLRFWCHVAGLHLDDIRRVARQRLGH